MSNFMGVEAPRLQCLLAARGIEQIRAAILFEDERIADLLHWLC